MAVLRLVRAVSAVAVDDAGAAAWQIAMPNLVGVFGQRIACDLATPGGIEDAEINARSVAGENGEIGPQSIPCGAQGKGHPGLEAIGERRHGSAFCAKIERREGWQGKVERLRFAVRRLRYRMERAAIAHVAAAIEARIGIHDLAPDTTPWHADTIAVTRRRCH